MLTTHYTALCDRLDKKSNQNHIKNYQMVVEEDTESGALNYLYKIQPGISKIQGAIKILMEMEYPDEIIQGVKRYDDDDDDDISVSNDILIAPLDN